MDMVLTLSQRSLVGKFEFINLTKNEILEWIREKWKPFIKNIPKVLALVNGWFVFHFSSEEDKIVVEEHFWVYGRGSLVLSHWCVQFDPWKLKMVKRHL